MPRTTQRSGRHDQDAYRSRSTSNKVHSRCLAFDIGWFNQGMLVKGGVSLE